MSLQLPAPRMHSRSPGPRAENKIGYALAMVAKRLPTVIAKEVQLTLRVGYTVFHGRVGAGMG